MKYLKLIIALLVVAASIGGLTYYFTRPSANETVEPTGSKIKQETVEKDIQDKIGNAPNNKFCPSAYDDILKRIDLFFKDEPSNQKTYTLMLQGEYTRKFVEQANYVFDRNSWNSNDISTIRRELKRCQSFSPDDTGLKSISNVLKDYDSLVSYNGKVKDACSQRPRCIANTNALYIDDDWNITKTNELINSVPNVTSKAKNSPVYQNTRKSKVEERLKKAHKKFIDDKMTYAEREAIGYNYNPARHGDWETMGSKLYVNFRTYNSKWGESVSAWQSQVASWERYTISQTPINNTGGY